MVIAATIIWIIGMIMVLVFGFAVAITGELHEEESLDKFFKDWGGTRFYTLYFLLLILCLPIWPLILITIWIVALVRGW